MAVRSIPFDTALTLRGVIVATLIYAGVNAAITLSAGPALALDDVKLNVLTQSLQAGYLPDNPPLFEWTLYAAQKFFGPTLASFVAVKYLFLLATALFTYCAAREAGGDARTGAIAALLLPLIPQIGWNFHQTLTHSTALFAATAFFWFALLRLGRKNSSADYALLGAAIGLGVLSKYSFIGAVGGAFAAAMLRPSFRSSLLAPKALVTLFVAAATIAPHVQWLASSGVNDAAVTQARLTGEATHLQRAIVGTQAVLWATLSFLAPLGVAGWLAGRTSHGALHVDRSLLSDAALAALAALFSAVIVFGVSNFQERYAIPFLYPAYLWLIIGFCRSAAGAHVIPALLACCLLVATAFAAARTAEAARPGQPFCHECRQHIPYAYLHRALAELGADDDTLVAFDDTTAGNLRRMFPRARVVSSHQPFYTPPAIVAKRCHFIWSTDIAPSPPQAVLEQLDPSVVGRAGGQWRRRMSGDKELRSTHWFIAAIDRRTPFGAALCRD